MSLIDWNFHRVEKMWNIAPTSFLLTLSMNSSKRFSMYAKPSLGSCSASLSTGPLKGVTMQTSIGCQCTLDVWGQLGLSWVGAVFCPEGLVMPGRASVNCLVLHPLQYNTSPFYFSSSHALTHWSLSSLWQCVARALFEIQARDCSCISKCCWN